MNKKTIENVYESLIILLALISIILVILDFANILNIEKYPYNFIDESIWIIFIGDYFGGLILSKNKKNYIKSHIFDLIAIIPVNALFSIFKIFRLTRILRFAKIFKLLRLIRFIGIAGKLKQRVTKFLKTNGFIYMLIICSSILVISALLFSITENISFDKSLWWAITTSTTVGYGDISPKTKFGKIIAIILMLVGISFVGILTSTFTAYFTDKEEKKLSKADEIRKYNALFKDGIITKEEFDKKKATLLK
ncbi:ion channel [Fructilactobacillus sp. Tb1]|uniref:ion channel n=1 Tax=Fructilactobacillus sp. Tb1 TaxID=3422304 RepID=UPI003D28CFBE